MGRVGCRRCGLIRTAFCFIALSALALLIVESPGPRAVEAAVVSRFFGSVTLNGQPAPVGTVVTAHIGVAKCGSTAVVGGETYDYVLDVVAKDQAAGCGATGATVWFTVGGLPANQTATWTSGAFTELDLSTVEGAPGAQPPMSGSAPAKTGRVVMTTVALVDGCNFVGSTFPDDTPPSTLSAAIEPAGSVGGLWAQQSPPDWAGFNPLFPEVSDMGPVGTLDVVAVCMSGSGTLTQPLI
jgi:hypothetical protein